MVAAAARPLLSPDDSTAVVVEVGFRYGERWSGVWKGKTGSRGGETKGTANGSLALTHRALTDY